MLAVTMLLHVPRDSPSGGGLSLHSWTLDPLLTVPLGLALLIYLTGWLRLLKRASAPVRPTLFLVGWLVLT